MPNWIAHRNVEAGKADETHSQKVVACDIVITDNNLDIGTGRRKTRDLNPGEEGLVPFGKIIGDDVGDNHARSENTGRHRHAFLVDEHDVTVSGRAALKRSIEQDQRRADHGAEVDRHVDGNPRIPRVALEDEAGDHAVDDSTGDPGGRIVIDDENLLLEERQADGLAVRELGLHVLRSEETEYQRLIALGEIIPDHEQILSNTDRSAVAKDEPAGEARREVIDGGNENQIELRRGAADKRHDIGNAGHAVGRLRQGERERPGRSRHRTPPT